MNAELNQLFLPHKWKPRFYQHKLWSYLEAGGKRGIEIAHRRWGKDEVCLHWAAVSLATKPGTYWHMLPQAAQARKAIWEAINPHTGIRRIDEAFPAELFERRETDMRIKCKLNGAIWQLVGSDNFDSIVGSPPVGVVFSEWALSNPRAWAYIRPILAENGGWALFITTPRGQNHAKRMYDAAVDDPTWFAEKQTVEDTKVFSDEMLATERKELCRELGEDDGMAMYRQEYFCDFEAAIMGSYYARFIADAEKEKRICRVPVTPGIPVITAWDLGYGDSTAIWFCQIVGREPRLIDYYEASGAGLEHYVQVLRDRKYNYGRHVLPHDAGHGSLRTGMTLVQQLIQMGVEERYITVLPREDIDPGIQLVRQLLPQVWIDADKCERGIDALKNYQRRWDDVRKVFSLTPLHNFASNGSDALRYLAVYLATMKQVVKKKDLAYPISQGEGAWMG